MKRVTSLLAVLRLLVLMLATAGMVACGSGGADSGGKDAVTSTTPRVGPPKDTLNVTALTSGGGVTPTVPGMSPNQWFYAISLPSGSSLSDTFPVQFSVSNTDNSAGNSYTITLNAVGSPALTSGTAVPAPFSISDDGISTTKTIVVSTGTLADGNYDLNIQVAGPPGALVIGHNTIHIQVTVGGSAAVDCFFTSSDFLFLTDCGGQEVSGNSGGTFQIVPNNRGKVVATNSGQFYYNALWTNDTGHDVTVVINLDQTGLSPMGANSVHALTFNASGFTADDSNFDMVNSDGTPCGPSGPCTVTVHSGDVLWVTWHLQFGSIGASASSFSSVCPGNSAGAVSAQVILTDDDTGNELGRCEATASGFLKR